MRKYWLEILAAIVLAIIAVAGCSKAGKEGSTTGQSGNETGKKLSGKIQIDGSVPYIRSHKPSLRSL